MSQTQANICLLSSNFILVSNPKFVQHTCTVTTRRDHKAKQNGVFHKTQGWDEEGHSFEKILNETPNNLRFWTQNIAEMVSQNFFFFFKASRSGFRAKIHIYDRFYFPFCLGNINCFHSFLSNYVNVHFDLGNFLPVDFRMSETLELYDLLRKFWIERWIKSLIFLLAA